MEREEGIKPGCSLTPLVLMTALSVHSLFEGIATGMASDTGDLVSLIVAIVLHKWAAAMSLGISMSRSLGDNKVMIISLLTIFSLATPIGIIIGAATMGQSEITDVIFNSLAAGTFVYIACSEVIIEEFSLPNAKFVKMLVFLFGIVLITVITYFAE